MAQTCTLLDGTPCPPITPRGVLKLQPPPKQAQAADKMEPGPWRDYVYCVTGGRSNTSIAMVAATLDVQAEELAKCRNALAHGGKFGADPPMDTVAELCVKPH